MSKKKQITSLIESLEKTEFDEFVKIYLSKEYGYNKIVFTDGKSDTGIDIKVFDFSGSKLQFQLTTQKSSTRTELGLFEKKIREDFQKAKQNHDDFGYRDRLLYFYSYKLSNERIRQYEKEAFREYSINLEMIDANMLAQESDRIIELQSFLYRTADLDKFHVDNASFDNTLFFDLLSFGKPTEFKTQVIDSFILQSFFKQRVLSIEQIKSACEAQFNVKENDVFYERVLSRFQTEKRVSKDKTGGGYLLIESEYQKLKNKNEQFEVEKRVFLKSIEDILASKGQTDYLEEYVKELKQLYVDNFSADFKDVIENNQELQLFGVFKSFVRFIEKKTKDSEDANDLAKTLLKYCLDNKFIQKVAATKVYSSKIDNNRLSNYLTNKKKIFIDTAIGLYALCYYYKPKTSFKNYFFRATKNLLEYSTSEKVKLHISERYIWEIQNNVNEAINLVPFTKIPRFESLGTSSNVFFSFYSYLKSSGEINDITFSQFISDFGWSDGRDQKSLASEIEYSLSKLNIIKQHINDYDLEEPTRAFEMAITKFNRHKTVFTRNNDSVMLAYLSDNDIDLHPLQPLFLTWDKTFFEAHMQFLKKFPTAQRWLILTPNKFIDVYALLKFSINSETVTENLLALISDDIIEDTYSLIDNLTIILNPENEVGLEYTNRIRKIREDEINKLNQINAENAINSEQFDGTLAIDEIFYKLMRNYRESKLDAFKSLFTREEVMDDVIGIITKSIEEFNKTKQITDSLLFKAFDDLMAPNDNPNQSS